MVGDVLFVSTSFSQVAAIDAATGRTVWVYDPETWTHGTPSNNGFVHRGVGYWAAGDDRSILFGTGDGYLICLNARRGRPIPTFGDGGRIDLTHGLGRPVDRKLYGVSSPPVVCAALVIMGSKVHDIPLAAAMPPGMCEASTFAPAAGPTAARASRPWAPAADEDAGHRRAGGDHPARGERAARGRWRTRGHGGRQLRGARS